MKIGINGYGRIGRVIHRIISLRDDIELVAINDVNPDINNLVYLANYDSTYGVSKNKFSSENNFIFNDREKIRVTNIENIDEVPWDEFGVEILIDSSGIAKNLLLSKNLKGKVKNVIVTNSPDEDKVDKTIIYGVNHEHLNKLEDFLISSSICDATAFAPLIKLVNDHIKVQEGSLTTLHPWLGYQNLLDGPSKAYSAPGEIYDEYALGRSAFYNLIPKNTSAISATYKVLPELKDKFLSLSYRTPTMIVSSADATVILENEIDLDEVKEILFDAEKNNEGIFFNNQEPLVSSDLIGNSNSVIIDHRFLKSKGKILKILSWYDNEWGYSSRVVDLVNYLRE